MLFSAGLNIKYVLFVLLVLGGSFAVERFSNPRRELYSMAMLAVAGSIFIYTVFPNIFLDDTGFVIRYMNMAREGCFYCYNASDGPVFGVSSFLYGLATMGLAMTNMASNESIIIGLNFLGLVVAFFVLARTFLKLTSSVFLSVSGVAFIVLASTRFLFSSTAGLETNFHLAIVLTGIYFFVSDNRKWMWLFFGLSVISKLDTVPLITILSAIHLFENRKDYFGKSWLKNWLVGVLYAGVPIVAFLAITFMLFDGPLPQSAYAKLYHHSHPSTHWFPFLELMMDKGNRTSLFLTSLSFPLIHLTISLFRNTFKLHDFFFILGFAATMLLFYFYNPVERMVWYYALPELLLFSQLMFSVVWLIRQTMEIKTERLRTGSYALIFSALCIAAVPMTMGEKQWMDRYLTTVELERLEIGNFISEFPASDSLVSAHGHFGANYGGYILDVSGLNSKLATDFELNTDSILKMFKPRYLINHANSATLDAVRNNGYSALREWNAVEEYGYPKWVLYERQD